MKLFIVLAVSMMILASMVDVSDAKVDNCKIHDCTAEGRNFFCAVNSHDKVRVFINSCDLTQYNCKHNDDFEKADDMRVDRIVSGFFSMVLDCVKNV